MLAESSGTNKPTKIFVDNLHSPYALFDEEYILPGSSIHSPDYDSALLYLQKISEFIPEAVFGCHVLPEPRPKRDVGKLSLVKEIIFDNIKYLYILKFDIAHLGGAKKEDILKNPSQYHNASVRTNRIYFSIRIVPVAEIYCEKGQIIDFNVLNYDPSIFQTSTEKLADSARRIVSEIFDEIDFTFANTKIREQLQITLENWAPGKVYEPAVIEFLTISLRFLILSQKELFRDFETFHEIIGFIFSGEKIPPEKSVENYLHWLRTFQAERTVSLSGNMLWRILKI